MEQRWVVNLVMEDVEQRGLLYVLLQDLEEIRG